MIKAMCGDDVILVIDKENIKRLKKGEPIKVIGSDIGIKNDIYIEFSHDINKTAKKFESKLRSH